MLYLGLIGLTVRRLLAKVPQGFVPAQDKDYLIAFAQLPDASTLDRTEGVIRKMSAIALKHPGVANSVAFPGLSINGFVNASNAGIVFVILKPADERQVAVAVGDGDRAGAQSAVCRRAGGVRRDLPAAAGAGHRADRRLQALRRGSRRRRLRGALHATCRTALGQGYQTPSLTGLFSSFQVNVPQIDTHVDRERAKTYGVALTDVFETLQVYLGSLYANDFNRFGRTYQVNVQAESAFRLQPEQIGRLKTRNAAGDMVPLGSLVTVTRGHGPDQVMHYNGYPAAEINGGPAPGFSSGQAQDAIAQVLDGKLPRGYAYEWTELAYQEKIAGNTMFLIFPLCVLLVYVVLAAQYQSWTLPLVGDPDRADGAVLGDRRRLADGGDNNVFTQVSFLVLAGLACKNAILIVEFARQRETEGADHLTAILDACRIRLRPVLMTSVAFIMGVVPLVFSSGAGAEIRYAMGVAVFAGMLGVTAFGLFFTPVFYLVLARLIERFRRRRSLEAPVVHDAVSAEGA